MYSITIQSTGFLDVKIVRMKWDQHLAGQRNWQHQISSVLMFQAWYFDVHRPGSKLSLNAAV